MQSGKRQVDDIEGGSAGETGVAGVDMEGGSTGETDPNKCVRV